jgi:flavin reductase (DIM6/NTAB) family NADH-FMN oxidoreductase RutF
MDIEAPTVTHFYRPAEGHRLKHDPFKAIVAPRPIGWIGTIDDAGRVNLAPYSFFNGISSRPPMVAFASEGWKDSVRNVEATGEFVCNLVSHDLAPAMNETSAPLPPGENEMLRACLAAAPSTVVRPPRVARAIAALECRRSAIIRLAAADGRELESWLVLGEVVGVHIDPSFLKDGIFDTAAARPVARCGYAGDYAEVTALFQMTRPTE